MGAYVDGFETAADHLVQRGRLGSEAFVEEFSADVFSHVQVGWALFESSSFYVGGGALPSLVHQVLCEKLKISTLVEGSLGSYSVVSNSLFGALQRVGP